MSSEHVEVLERLRGVLEHGKMGDKCLIAPDLVTAAIAALSAPQPPADAHCTTCSCVPGMTPAVRFDATPAEKEGAVRDHLISMGWTPPAEARKGNTPIAELIADYESNGCDHSDMAWVKRAALHYVDTMQDSQVRCLLYTLASPPSEAQPCGCGEATCTVPWEPGCGLGKSEQHAVVQAQPVAWLGADPRTGVPKLWFKAPAPSVIRDFAMRPLYAHPPPSAPVEVEAIVEVIISDPANATDTDTLRRCVASALAAQQPASDGGFTAADMMDARQEGREEAQQPADEVEALREEVERWKSLHATAYDAFRTGVATERRLEAHAERLAEALRECISFLPDRGIPGMHKDTARAALRDHDQEGTNDR